MRSRIKPHPNYKEPTNAEMHHRFQQIGFNGSYSPQMIRDLANAYSHVQNGESIEFTNPENSYEMNIQKFISQLNWNNYSGDTPLQKAASVTQAMSKIKGATGGEGEGEPLPFFTEEQFDSETMSKIEENLKHMKKLSPNAKKYIFKEGISPEGAVAEMSEEQKNIINNLALIAKKGVESRKISAKRILKPMTEYSQVSKLANMSDIGMPLFDYKFATKQLIIRKNLQSAKQTLILLIDDSGSMTYSRKVEWLKAILINRLEAVIAGKAELYISTFISSAFLNDTIYISNATQAKEFLESKWFPSMNGDQTDIQNSLAQTEAAIKSRFIGPHKVNPKNTEIMIINDGQDYIDNKFQPKYKTHCFILGQENDNLKQVIEASGGSFQYIELD